MKWFNKIFSGKKSVDRNKKHFSREGVLAGTKKTSIKNGADLIKGYRFVATLKITTPSEVISKHGDFSKKPPQNKADPHGSWLAKTKTYRELGIPIDELVMDNDTQASDIGPVKPENYLPFLKSFRHIVESQQFPVVGKQFDFTHILS